MYTYVCILLCFGFARVVSPHIAVLRRGGIRGRGDLVPPIEGGNSCRERGAGESRRDHEHAADTFYEAVTRFEMCG